MVGQEFQAQLRRGVAMARDLLVHTQRKQHIHLFNVPIRLDNVSPLVLAGAGGAIPYNTYEMYTLQGIPDIQQGDLLLDTHSTDQYRVSGNPEILDTDHIECLIEKVVSKTP
jgi:hypothetical protein